MFLTAAKVTWFVVQPSSLLLLLALTSIVMLWTRFAATGRRIALVAALLFLVAGLSPLGHLLILPLEERFARVELTADAQPTGIIVLGGAQDTLVSAARGVVALNEAAERIVEGVVLARRFPGAKLVFSGGSRRLFYTGAREAEAAAALFRNLGIDGRRFLLENRARDTYENALFTRDLVKPSVGERWLLVTSAAHMPRAMGCFRKVGFAVLPWPVDYRTRGIQDVGRFFDKPSGGLRRVDAATREWAGLAVYYLTGRTSALFPGALSR